MNKKTEEESKDSSIFSAINTIASSAQKLTGADHGSILVLLICLLVIIALLFFWKSSNPLTITVVILILLLFIGTSIYVIAKMYHKDKNNTKIEERRKDREAKYTGIPLRLLSQKKNPQLTSYLMPRLF
ncbi:hypothetical protein [Dictyobacter kobayashii]|uniref:hypothetical protein n=1 Tax=Dictyobacter kobayashii TaxID=2014872 RepID=UPI000F8165C9|nr:hypothetical protein [Dictyobacter kobayashii]